MRHKSPSELSSKTVRINIDDWAMLKELARKADVTVAEVFHQVLEHQAQLPMLEMRVRPTISIPGKVDPHLVTNGSQLKSNVLPTIELQARAKGVINE